MEVNVAVTMLGEEKGKMGGGSLLSPRGRKRGGLIPFYTGGEKKTWGEGESADFLALYIFTEQKKKSGKERKSGQSPEPQSDLLSDKKKRAGGERDRSPLL